MEKYNPETKEQIIKLKDGRTIFKTHNGFKHWLDNGEIMPISEEYYNKVKKNRSK